MGKTKSIWKFKTADSFIEVWWARIVQPQDSPEFKFIGKAPRSPYFWLTAKLHLHEYSDGTWHEPAVYENGMWRALWE